MRIVLDGGPLTVATGGIRRYVEELSVALACGYSEDAVHVLADRSIQPSKRMLDAGVEVHEEAARGLDRRWWLFGLARACRRLGASVFHGTDFAVPYLHRVPAVMTIHDLSPWRNPSWQPDAGRIRRRTPWLLRLGRADYVITVSKAMRSEIISFFGLPEDRVHAIPLAADPRFQPVGVAHRSKPYFLFVGTLEARKNIPHLVSSWRAVFAESGVPLKIAGRRRGDFHFVSEYPGLEWLGAVPEEELPALYAGALAVVYPSEYEGFGLPALEAMQSGVPVVVGPAAALRELVADAGMVLSSTAGGELSKLMYRLAEDAAFRDEWAARGIRQAAQFSWGSTARQTRAVYEEAIARFEREA